MDQDLSARQVATMTSCMYMYVYHTVHYARLMPTTHKTIMFSSFITVCSRLCTLPSLTSNYQILSYTATKDLII